MRLSSLHRLDASLVSIKGRFKVFDNAIDAVETMPNGVVRPVQVRLMEKPEVVTEYWTTTLYQVTWEDGEQALHLAWETLCG